MEIFKSKFAVIKLLTKLLINTIIIPVNFDILYNRYVSITSKIKNDIYILYYIIKLLN